MINILSRIRQINAHNKLFSTNMNNSNNTNKIEQYYKNLNAKNTKKDYDGKNNKKDYDGYIFGLAFGQIFILLSIYSRGPR